MRRSWVVPAIIPLGGSFIFEDADRFWRAEPIDRQLHGPHRRLTLKRFESIRPGDAVTGVEIKAWSPPKQ